MQFPLSVYLFSFLAAFAVSFATLPIWCRYCAKTGLVDGPGYRKIHTTPTPLAGGLAVVTGLLLPIALGVVAVVVEVFGRETSEIIGHGFRQRVWQLTSIFAGVAGMFLLGRLDDRHELRPSIKFSGQFLIALVVVTTGIRITLFVDNVYFSHAISVLWILTLVNAFNFSDNMNGLCSGLGLIASIAFAISAALAGQYLVTSLALLSAGALLGFLPYNFPKASAFLGDSGSHVVGFTLAVLAILTTFYSADSADVRSHWAVVSPILILIVPLVDLVWVVLVRWKLRKPFYLGDNNHISHQLAKRGLGAKNAVLVLWLVAVIAAGASFLL